MKGGCPFCDYDGPSPVIATMSMPSVPGFPPDDFFVIEPLNPVTPGHLLVIPRAHVSDFRLFGALLGSAMQVACDVACGQMAEGVSPGHNLIVSAGEAATQTVKHLHVHVVPRRPGDGLKLPWSA